MIKLTQGLSLHDYWAINPVILIMCLARTQTPNIGYIGEAISKIKIQEIIHLYDFFNISVKI